MWTSRGKRFIRDTLEACVVDTGEIDDCSSDEAAINVGFWQSNKPTHELCLQDPYKTYWERLYFENSTTAARDIQMELGNRTIAFDFCHGIKDAGEAKHMLARMKRLFKETGIPRVLQDGELLTHAKRPPHGAFGEPCLLG